ncbi:MAG: DNA primase, partial [Pseudomonadota bacterium]
MRFDEHFIQKVIEANNVVGIIAQYTELKGRGDQHMGLCPFPDHNEKSPSFSVSESKQLYHCFGCKKAGNVITFLKTYNGFSFVESIEYLANRARIDLPKEPEKNGVPRRRVSQDSKNQMFRANKFAAVFYHQKLKSLPKTHKLQSYLKKRNLAAEIIDDFRIGYAPEPWDELLKFLTSKGVPIAISQKLGLTRANKKGGHFDLFRDRLMFPIFAIDSEVIGFGGRIIDQGQPKYINSVESDVFKKGQSFYGLEKSAKFIRTEDRVFVVEGYMDLLALYSRGIKNVVATLG